MTSHLEEGRLQELLDGEIPSPELPPVQAHLTLCAECRARLEEARAIGAEADRLIETIDLAETPVRVVPHVPRARPGAWIRNAAWAATLVIAAGTGYLARGSRMASTASPSRNDKAAPIPATPVLPSPTADEPAPRVSGPARERQGGPLTSSPSGSARPERRGAATKTAGRLAAPRNAEVAPQDAKKSRDSGLVLNEIVTTGVAEPAAQRTAAASAAKPTTPPPSSRPEQALKASANRLDEMVVGGASDQRAARPVEISLPEALKRLDGSLRLIEGLVPLRLEALGAEVRVVYPLVLGELVLAERLESGKLTYRLVAPAGFPADSLEMLRLRVRD